MMCRVLAADFGPVTFLSDKDELNGPFCGNGDMYNPLPYSYLHCVMGHHIDDNMFLDVA